MPKKRKRKLILAVLFVLIINSLGLTIRVKKASSSAIQISDISITQLHQSYEETPHRYQLTVNFTGPPNPTIQWKINCGFIANYISAATVEWHYNQPGECINAKAEVLITDLAAGKGQKIVQSIFNPQDKTITNISFGGSGTPETPKASPPKAKEEVLLALPSDCSPEDLENLIKNIKALKSERDKIEQQQKEILKENENLKKSLEETEKKLTETENQITQAKQTLNQAKLKLKEIYQTNGQQEIEISQIQKASNSLQKILTSSQGTRFHQGENPLKENESGGALSFDDGRTWLIGLGDKGVEQLIQNLRRDGQIKDEIIKLGGKLKELTKKQEQTAKNMRESEEKIQDLENQIQEKENLVNQLQKDRTKALAEAGEGNQQAEELNQKIEKLTKALEDCGQKVKDELNLALDRFSKMSTDDAKEAEAKFIQNATEEEKKAYEEFWQIDPLSGGVTLGGVAQKLTEAMQQVSQCSEGEKKEIPAGEWQTSFRRKGVDSLWLIGMWGLKKQEGSTSQYLGAKDDPALKAINEIEKGLEVTGYPSLVSDIFSALTDYNILGLLYNFWSTPAQNAILDTLARWRAEGKDVGWPSYVKFGYGKFWELDVNEKIANYRVYECYQGIWQYKKNKTETEYRTGRCWYTDKKEEYEADVGEEHWSKYILPADGDNPNYVPPRAWFNAYQYALEIQTMPYLQKQKGITFIGPCPENQVFKNEI